MLIAYLPLILFHIVWRALIVLVAAKIIGAVAFRSQDEAARIDRSIAICAIIWAPIYFIGNLHGFDVGIANIVFGFAFGYGLSLIPFLLVWLLLRSLADKSERDEPAGDQTDEHEVV